MNKEVTLEDAKKLAQRCKALEAQLRQTVTKKEHHEIVLDFEGKMTNMEKTVSNQEKKIGDQERELERTKAELQRSVAMNKQIGEVSEQIIALAKSNDSQVAALDSLVKKATQGVVPLAVHQQSLSRIIDLEDRIGGMVSKSEFTALRLRYEEAARRIGGMIPASEHEALKERVLELEDRISNMVPREEFESSEATVKELQDKLAEHVPQSMYDDLVSRVVQLAEEVTDGQAFSGEHEQAPQEAEQTEPEQPSPAELEPERDTGVPESPAPVPTTEAAAAEPATEVAVSQEQAVPEISEVGSKLAELKTEAVVETEPPEAVPAEAFIPASTSKETEAEADVLLAPVTGSEGTEKNDQQA